MFHPASPVASLSSASLQGGEGALDSSQVRAKAVPGGAAPVRRASGSAAAEGGGGGRPEVGGGAVGPWHQGGG